VISDSRRTLLTGGAAGSDGWIEAGETEIFIGDRLFAPGRIPIVACNTTHLTNISDRLPLLTPIYEMLRLLFQLGLCAEALSYFSQLNVGGQNQVVTVSPKFKTSSKTVE
jgi:hypothetical protein